MPIPEKFYDAEGNIVSLNKLCRLEPDWAANQIRRLYEELDKKSKKKGGDNE